MGGVHSLKVKIVVFMCGQNHNSYTLYAKAFSLVQATNVMWGSADTARALPWNDLFISFIIT